MSIQNSSDSDNKCRHYRQKSRPCRISIATIVVALSLAVGVIYYGLNFTSECGKYLIYSNASEFFQSPTNIAVFQPYWNSSKSIATTSHRYRPGTFTNIAYSLKTKMVGLKKGLLGRQFCDDIICCRNSLYVVTIYENYSDDNLSLQKMSPQ